MLGKDNQPVQIDGAVKGPTKDVNASDATEMTFTSDPMAGTINSVEGTFSKLRLADYEDSADCAASPRKLRPAGYGDSAYPTATTEKKAKWCTRTRIAVCATAVTAIVLVGLFYTFHATGVPILPPRSSAPSDLRSFAVSITCTSHRLSAKFPQISVEVIVHSKSRNEYMMNIRNPEGTDGFVFQRRNNITSVALLGPELMLSWNDVTGAGDDPAPFFDYQATSPLIQYLPRATAALAANGVNTITCAPSLPLSLMGMSIYRSKPNEAVLSPADIAEANNATDVALNRTMGNAGNKHHPAAMTLASCPTCTRRAPYSRCGNSCFGMCGKGCGCWSWVCGDCNCRLGCQAHDETCSCGTSTLACYSFASFFWTNGWDSCSSCRTNWP